MKFIWDQVETSNYLITAFIILLVYALVLFSLIKTSKRKIPFIVLACSFILTVISFIFYLQLAFIVVQSFTIVFLIVIATSNIGDFNRFLANPFKKPKAKSGNFGVEKIFDHEDFKKKVETAVLHLAQTKTGAIITFEKSKSLDNFIKNGVRVDAPLTPELLETIFYPGTRLHDGAVIVHGNMVVAASVFFALTTQPFAVKYGSRHRAAIGISEVCDAVTIVVSEETGRISFAVNGGLEPVDASNFSRVFETYMSDDIGVE